MRRAISARCVGRACKQKDVKVKGARDASARAVKSPLFLVIPVHGWFLSFGVGFLSRQMLELGLYIISLVPKTVLE